MHRRRFLASAATAAAGLTAGCSGFLGGDGGDGTTGGDGATGGGGESGRDGENGGSGGEGDGDGPSDAQDGGGPTMPAEVTGRYAGFQGGPRHRGVADGSVGGGLGEVWAHGEPSTDTGHHVATPAIVDGTAYVPEGTMQEETATAYVTALDVRSGEVEWQFALEGTNAVDDAVFADGVVLQRFGGVLVALDAASGEESWRLDADLDVTPAASDGTVFVSGSDFDASTLYALAIDGGEQLWSESFERSGRGTLVPPAVDDGLVYHVEDGLVGRDVADGSEQWTAATERAVGTAPTITDERIFVGTAGNRIAAIERASGEVAWSSEVASAGESGGRITPASPAVDGDRLVTTSLWSMTVLSASSGAEQWSKTTDVDGPPVIAGDAAYVAGLDQLAAFDLGDGTRRAHFPTANESGSPVSPAIVDGVVCYPSDRLYALASSE